MEEAAALPYLKAWDGDAARPGAWGWSAPRWGTKHKNGEILTSRAELDATLCESHKAFCAENPAPDEDGDVSVVLICPKLLCGAGDTDTLPCTGSESPRRAGAPGDELPRSPAFGEGLGAAGAPPLVIYLGRSSEPPAAPGVRGDAVQCVRAA